MSPIGQSVEALVSWLENFGFIFTAVQKLIESVVGGLQWLLLLLPHFALIALVVVLTWRLAGSGVAVFVAAGLGLIVYMNLWLETIQTLALVLTAGFFALLIGIPLGIWAAKNDTVDKLIRPVLDFMQTMPSFVYLIPAVTFFSLGPVPGVVATVVFAMPPAVRLTNLGIRQVPTEVIEAAESFGSTPNQLLFKVQLPLALPTIMAGVNQSIMMSLSMVVIAAMIGAGGLGGEVLRGITQLEVGKGFEAGLAVVIIAIFLDRITQALVPVRGRHN
ncbi:MAG: glycine betaine/proline transport system permease protein [Bacillota bacterium]|jgi:glycine betaine/proline transport system permease protein|nr:glycine betaine/proline transport system permease protein [Bacillota bacterium]MDK2856298.1 glycine betaine/proline transport system permease protein [Bacillota bacterium]MDK2926018.1 glycine betaine/proline transport system permease protein [Bacillota bacterium]